ncbi:MAG: hypothetical protein COA60_006880 [Robiginitomaculum sp.]|nr:hypothetical protein [Robiginitomaculum sp.]
MSDIEKLIRNRSRVTLAMGTTFALWQGGQIITKLVPTTSEAYGLASVIVTLGAIGYALAAIAFWIYFRKVQKANAGCLINDDWARHIRGLAIQYGFFYLLGAIALMYAYVQFWTLPSDIVLQFCILVAVSSTIFSYVWLEKKGDASQ